MTEEITKIQTSKYTVYQYISWMMDKIDFLKQNIKNSPTILKIIW